MEISRLSNECPIDRFLRNCENVPQIIFAEELVSFIMNICGFPEFCLNKVQRHQPSADSAFTEEMILAAGHLGNLLYGEVFKSVLHLERVNMVSAVGFQSYWRNVVSGFEIHDWNIGSVLETCVRIALTAFFFYREGIHEAPLIAVSAISRTVDYDLRQGGWEILQNAAENISDKYFRKLLPSSNISESSNPDYSVGDSNLATSAMPFDSDSSVIVANSNPDSSAKSANLNPDNSANTTASNPDANTIDSIPDNSVNTADSNPDNSGETDDTNSDYSQTLANSNTDNYGNTAASNSDISVTPANSTTDNSGSIADESSNSSMSTADSNSDNSAITVDSNSVIEADSGDSLLISDTDSSDIAAANRSFSHNCTNADGTGPDYCAIAVYSV